MRTVVLLTISNIFMTFAWYGHLRFKKSPLWMGHRQLDDCIFRVLLSGTRKSHRVVSIFNRPVENDSGSDHACRLFDFFSPVFARTIPVELRGRFCVYRRGGVFYVL